MADFADGGGESGQKVRRRINSPSTASDGRFNPNESLCCRFAADPAAGNKWLNYLLWSLR
jgi:hypothetical protein